MMTTDPKCTTTSAGGGQRRPPLFPYVADAEAGGGGEKTLTTTTTTTTTETATATTILVKASFTPTRSAVQSKDDGSMPTTSKTTQNAATTTVQKEKFSTSKILQRFEEQQQSSMQQADNVIIGKSSRSSRKKNDDDNDDDEDIVGTTTTTTRNTALVVPPSTSFSAVVSSTNCSTSTHLPAEPTWQQFDVQSSPFSSQRRQQQQQQQHQQQQRASSSPSRNNGSSNSSIDSGKIRKTEGLACDSAAISSSSGSFHRPSDSDRGKVLSDGYGGDGTSTANDFATADGHGHTMMSQQQQSGPELHGHHRRQDSIPSVVVGSNAVSGQFDAMTLSSEKSNETKSTQSTQEEYEKEYNIHSHTNVLGRRDSHCSATKQTKAAAAATSDIRSPLSGRRCGSGNEYTQAQFQYWKSTKEDGPPLLRAVAIVLTSVCLTTSIVPVVFVGSDLGGNLLGWIICVFHAVHLCFWILVLEIKSFGQVGSSSSSSSLQQLYAPSVPMSSSFTLADADGDTTVISHSKGWATATVTSGTTARTVAGNKYFDRCDEFIFGCLDQCPDPYSLRSRLQRIAFQYINGLRFLSSRGLLWMMTGSVCVALGDISSIISGSSLLCCGVFALQYGIYASHRSNLLMLSITDDTYLWTEYCLANPDQDGTLNVDQFKSLISKLGLTLDKRYSEDIFEVIAVSCTGSQVSPNVRNGRVRKITYSQFKTWWLKEHDCENDEETVSPSRPLPSRC